MRQWPGLGVLSPVHDAQLPAHCSPTTAFLRHVSSFTHNCIPTPLAFVSTLLGILSIFSWLFAQLPQIIRNYKNHSVGGLSLFFLVEWCLGDLSNLLGALLTNQASWQVIVAGYYCFVDLAMILQWIWYEKLKHGRPLKLIKLSRLMQSFPHRRGDRTEYFEAPTSTRSHSPSISWPNNTREGHESQIVPRDIPTPKAEPANNMFRTPVYGTMSPTSSLARSPPPNRTIERVQQKSLPTASPKTVMFVSLIIALASSTVAAPTVHTNTDLVTLDQSFSNESVGTLLSWCSTVLYLLSRIPQIVLNFQRRSTSGLSPTLFAAAFCGNLFYSSSLLSNPLAWSDMGPYGEHGWTGSKGNNRFQWCLAALPFFLGAAGVLMLDGAVGVQFWIYGEGKPEYVIVEEETPPGTRSGWSDTDVPSHERRLRVKKISGWMRGWQPSVSGRVTPAFVAVDPFASERDRAREDEPLLRIPEGDNG